MQSIIECYRVFLAHLLGPIFGLVFVVFGENIIILVGGGGGNIVFVVGDGTFGYIIVVVGGGFTVLRALA